MNLLSHLLAWLWAGPPALYQFAPADLEDGATRYKRAPPVCDAERPTAHQRDAEHEQKRLQDLGQRNAQLAQANAGLTAELDTARKELASATADAAAARSRVAELEAHNAELVAALDVAHAEVRQYHAELARFRGENDLLRVERAHSAHALEERAQEVRSLQAFLTKTDAWTGAEVIQAVEDLNAEIVQLAAGVADALGPALVPAPREAGAHDTGMLEGVLGDEVMRMLATRDHSADGHVVQLALQAWAVHCCARVLDAFCAGLPPAVDDFLVQLFDRMHRSEPQPTSARWRALAHEHSRALLGAASSDLGGHISYHARGASAILALAGASAELTPRHAAGLLRLAERAQALRRALSEEVMSACFVISGAPRANFDEETQEDVLRGASPARPSRVLCATALGVICERHVDEDPVLERTVLLKPKVLLDSAEELL